MTDTSSSDETTPSSEAVPETDTNPDAAPGSGIAEKAAQ